MDVGRVIHVMDGSYRDPSSTSQAQPHVPVPPVHELCLAEKLLQKMELRQGRVSPFVGQVSLGRGWTALLDAELSPIPNGLAIMMVYNITLQNQVIRFF